MPSNLTCPVKHVIRLLLLRMSLHLVGAILLPVPRAPAGNYSRLATKKDGASWTKAKGSECAGSAPASPKQRVETGKFEPCTDVLHERFRKAAQHNCGGHCDVVLVGASIIEHTAVGSACSDIGTKFEGVRFSGSRAVFHEDVELPLLRSGFQAPLVLAASREKTEHMLWRLGDLLPLANDPKVFSLLIGSNDIRDQQTPADVACGIKELVRVIHKAHPTSRVLVQAMYPRFDLEGQLVLAIKDTNALVSQAIADARAHWLHFVDCSDRVSPESLVDGIHPSPELYKLLWAPCIMPAISRLLESSSSVM
eukprot:TRINITY_DN6549_c0_g1_i2.p1 TRINITY_DN6549_c0_g1~~TRINITY_DN6549_c0_g1_i2.p1  ORF type:complete len:309 (+),score=26.17 TRINITY_DN6549_c0_g1_i2:112-1038(+)